MTERDRLIDQLEREYRDDPWHGPALLDILHGIGAADASRRVAPHTHTIWELLTHMTAWKREVAARLRGAASGDPADGDWRQTERLTAAGWEAALKAHAAAHEELIGAIRNVPEASLHALVRDDRTHETGGVRTAWETVMGLVQHDAYHAGQIALLKKILAGAGTAR